MLIELWWYFYYVCSTWNWDKSNDILSISVALVWIYLPLSYETVEPNDPKMLKQPILQTYGWSNFNSLGSMSKFINFGSTRRKNHENVKNTVKPLITNTSKELIKRLILHFLIMECCRYLVFSLNDYMELFKTVPAYLWLFIYFRKYWNLRNIVQGVPRNMTVSE